MKNHDVAPPSEVSKKGKPCKHVLSANHRKLMSCYNVERMLIIVRLCIGVAGWGTARTISVLLDDALRVLLKSRFSHLIDRDEEGRASTKGIAYVASFLFTLIYIGRRGRLSDLGDVDDNEGRIRSHRDRSIPKDPVLPGTVRPLVSGHPNANLDPSSEDYVGEKTHGAAMQASRSTQCVINAGGLDRARALLRDPRVVKKLKKTQVEDGATPSKMRLSYFDMVDYAIKGVDRVVKKSNKAVTDILISMIIFFDRDGRVYLQGPISLQSAALIKTLVRLPNPQGLGHTAWTFIDQFFLSEFGYSVHDKKKLSEITSVTLTEWFLNGGCPREYEHCLCAINAHEENVYYFPISSDQEQSFSQLCATITGDALSMCNTNMMDAQPEASRGAWLAQYEASTLYDPNDLLAPSGLSFEDRKAIVKPPVTVGGYNAGDDTMVLAFFGLGKSGHTVKGILAFETITIGGEVHTPLQQFTSILSLKGLSRLDLVETALRSAGIGFNVENIMQHSRDFARSTRLAMATATPCSAIMQAALKGASKNAQETDLLREWVDALGFKCRLAEYKLQDEMDKERIYATPCFPPSVEGEEWLEDSRLRKALKFLPGFYNSSDLSLMPCYIQNVESAVIRYWYYLLASSKETKAQFAASTHDCIWADAAFMAEAVRLYHKAYTWVMRHTNVVEQFAHLDIPSQVTVQRWNDKGEVVEHLYDVIDTDRDVNLDRMEATMNPFGWNFQSDVE